MSLPHIGALKVIWLVGAAGVTALAVIDPTWKAAIIAGAVVSIPPTITGIFTIISQRVASARTHALLNKVEENTNNMNTKLQEKADTAAARADSAEGKLQGTKDEQNRTKGT